MSGSVAAIPKEKGSTLSKRRDDRHFPTSLSKEACPGFLAAHTVALEVFIFTRSVRRVALGRTKFLE
jgi:hypothetical protein